MKLLATLAPAGHVFKASASAAESGGGDGDGAFVLWSRTDGRLRRYEYGAAAAAAAVLEPTATGETGGGTGAAALALSADGRELLVVRDDDCDWDAAGEEETNRRWAETQRLHVFDAATLRPARASVAIRVPDGGGTLDDLDVAASGSRVLVSAGPGLACVCAPLRLGDAPPLQLHLVDTATGDVTHSLWDLQADGQVLFARGWATAGGAFVVVGTAAGLVAVLRVDGAARRLVRVAGARAGDSVDMLEVGPARADENAAFAVASGDGEPCVRRFVFRPGAEEEGQRLAPAGELRCDDMGSDMLMRTLVLASTGGVGAAPHDSGLWWWPPGGGLPARLAGDGTDHSYFITAVARRGRSTLLALGGGALLAVTDAEEK